MCIVISGVNLAMWDPGGNAARHSFLQQKLQQKLTVCLTSEASLKLLGVLQPTKPQLFGKGPYVLHINVWKSDSDLQKKGVRDGRMEKLYVHTVSKHSFNG